MAELETGDEGDPSHDEPGERSERWSQTHTSKSRAHILFLERRDAREGDEEALGEGGRERKGRSRRRVLSSTSLGSEKKEGARGVVVVYLQKADSTSGSSPPCAHIY